MRSVVTMAENKQETEIELKDAKGYVDAVMSSQQVVEVSSPFQVLSGRKRHLSLPEETSVKKIKNNDTRASRDIVKAKRSILSETPASTQKGETGSEPRSGEGDQQNLTSNKNGENTNKKEKDAAKPKKSAGVVNSGNTKASNKSSSNSKDDIASLIKAFDKMEGRYSSMENKFSDMEKIISIKD